MITAAKKVSALTNCDTDYTVTMGGAHTAYCFPPAGSPSANSVMFAVFTGPGEDGQVESANTNAWVIRGPSYDVVCADDRVLRALLPAFPDGHLSQIRG